MRNIIKPGGEVASKARIPRVGVGDVDIGGGIGHAQPSGQGLQRAVGTLECGIYAVDKDVFFFARGAHAVHGDIDDIAHETGELSYVNSGSAVYFRRVFFGKDSGSHAHPEYVSLLSCAEFRYGGKNVQSSAAECGICG